MSPSTIDYPAAVDARSSTAAVPSIQTPANSVRRRILVVDDNPAIHDDFRKILGNKKTSSEMQAAEAALFGDPIPAEASNDFQIDSAYQGQEALFFVKKSLRDNEPYTLAFVDVRMPPGWDGIETIGYLWEVDPRIQIVLCTAYSDYSWSEIGAKLKHSDRLLILKKPFDIIEINQLVSSLTEKWNLTRKLEAHVGDLEKTVHDRTLEVAESASMIKATLEATADGILAINRGTFTFNRRLLEMWQVPMTLVEKGKADAIFEHIVSHTNSPEFKKKLQTPNYTSSANEFDLIRFEDGRVFECCSYPRVVDGVAAGNVWSFRDISRRIAAEEQLRQAQKMECIGQLAGGVAHDFNNLLTVIHGHGVLLQDCVTEEGAAFLQEIVLAAQRGENLTRQLLTFSRRQVIQPNDIDLSEVVRNMEKMLWRLLGGSIDLRLEYTGEIPAIRADVGMMEQVLMNLAINARDAMNGAGRLTIHLAPAKVDSNYSSKNGRISPGEYVCLQIADTGSGISQQHLPRIFEPFFTTKEVGKGTGLGLATVYGIVKQHKGFIDVESELGKGTTFKLFFPSAGKIAAPAVEENDCSIRGGTETILLVEDEEAVRLLMGRILRDLGYNVLESPSAAQALLLGKETFEHIDLLLTDMVMPGGVSGRELAEILHVERPNLKVIFSSGFSPDLFGKELILNEGSNFLQKPYSPAKLAEAVRTILDHGRVNA